MRIDKEMFDNMTHEEKEEFRKGGDMILNFMASMGDKDAMLALQILKLCEKMKDLNLKVLYKNDEEKELALNFIKQIEKIIDDFEKEMEK